MVPELLQAIHRELENALSTVPGARTLLMALAELDPAAAADWLLTHQQDARETLGRPTLLRALRNLTDLDGVSRTGLPDDRLLALLQLYGDLLPADLVADALGMIPEGRSTPMVESVLHDALRRAPGHGGLLRRAAASAVAAQADEAHDLLTRLAISDPSLGTVQRVWKERVRLPPTGQMSVRAALLSSFTVDPLAAYLDLECRALGLTPELYIAPFNSWGREVVAPDSGFRQFDPEIAFLSVTADDLLPELADPVSEFSETRGNSAVDQILAVAAHFSEWSRGVLVVHSLGTVHPDPLGPAAGRSGVARGDVLAQMNARLAAGLRDLPRTYLLDISDVVMRRPGGAFDNPKMRHLARMRLGEGVLLDLAKSYAGYIAPLKGLTRKCVVLDLDNTLWGGIVGEDGPHGIRLGDTSPGSEYREFQRYLRILVERGILLAINSKNNPEDALEVIQRHDAMILRADSFSAVEINWQPKPDNMQRIARTLGLGLDTFVFVDDSPKERALMRHALPQVLTPELPADPARYRPTLERLPQLQALVVTDEDRTRTIQYLARREREQVRVTAHDLDEYLRSLDIVIEVGRASTATLSRVHQLFQRTNQFNLTGRRYELGTLTALAEDDDYRLYVAKASDRFGDHGLVASALVRLEGSQWLVENFVMSCRVIGYGVEGALLARLSKDAQDSGAAMLVGQYLETAKNAPARDFYTLHSFAPSDVSNGVHRWCRDLADGPVPTPAWITVRTARAS